MMRQQRLITLVLFVYFIQIHYVISAPLYEKLSSNPQRLYTKISQANSSVENDEDIVTSDEFTVPINPINRNSKSYASAYNGHIIHLEVIDKKFIPSTIFGLKYLKRLEIKNTCFYPCDRQEIPSHIEYLASSLTELSISDTRITHLPKQIGKLKRLQALKLSNTGLNSLPDSIGDLSLLAMLYLPNNNLKSLPVTIKNLRSLQQITLTNNPHLRSIQPLNGLPALRILDTRHCPIEVLPQNLPRLTDLSMTNNSLTKLSGIETLGRGTNSKKFFYFDKNHIKFIPTQILQVKNLFRLNLNHNQLDNLPEDISKITTLSYLNIQHNPFDPQDLKKIVSRLHNTNPNLTISHN